MVFFGAYCGHTAYSILTAFTFLSYNRCQHVSMLIYLFHKHKFLWPVTKCPVHFHQVPSLTEMAIQSTEAFCRTLSCLLPISHPFSLVPSLGGSLSESPSFCNSLYSVRMETQASIESCKSTGIVILTLLISPIFSFMLLSIL